MANTTVATELRVKQFLSEYYREFVRGNRFSRYTGTNSNNVINVKEGRKQIEIPLVNRLSGTGVSGSATLRGNGENIPNHGYTLTPTYFRNAVEMDREEMEKPNIDLMSAARPLLMDWSMEKIRDDVIEAMGAVHNGTSYFNYGDATAGQRNSWAVNNADRILYGATVSNYSGVHATDLAKLDATADELTKETLSLAKRMAKNARPRIRPVKVQEEEETFIAFCDSFAFRDLKASLASTHGSARERSKNNPLYRDGDEVWDGVIVREVPEIGEFIDNAYGSDWSSLATAGDSSGRVSPVFFCGAQALGYGMGQRPRIIVDRDYDYGFQPGVAVELKHDIDKLFFDDNSSGTSSQHVQHGMVTIWVNAAKDI